MSSILQAIASPLGALVVGIALLVSGEIIKRAFIEPINEQAQILVDISEALMSYGNRFTTLIVEYGRFDPRPVSDDKQAAGEASTSIRKLAARLRARNLTISWYGLWRLLGITPKREHVLHLFDLLIDLLGSTPPTSEKVVQANYKELAVIDEVLSTIYHLKKKPDPKLPDTPRDPVSTGQPPKVNQSEPQP